MKRLLSAACLCFAITARADVIRTYIGEQVRVPVPGITAAYSLDSDCAEATVEGDSVIVKGLNACVTHLTLVVGSNTTDVPVLVSSRLRSAENLRRAKLQEEHIQEAGTVSTSYSSNPGEVETSANLSRSQGDVNTTLGFSLANGYEFSPNARRTAIPYLSVQFARTNSSLTFFDSLVDQSPLTVESTYLRGLHIQTSTWFLHAGVASLTGFRQELLEPDPDRTVDLGYRFQLTPHSGLTPAFQWIRASHQYVSGVSGYIGSLLYEYQIPQTFHLELEAAASDGVAGAANLDYFGEASQLQLRVRSTPRGFAGMSMARPRGFQGGGTFTHSFSHNLGLDLSASRDTYALLDQGTQSNMTGNARLQYRWHQFTLTGGAATADLSRLDHPSILSTSFFTGVSYDRHRFGNSFQYQYSHNRAQDLGSHSFRDAVHLLWRRTRLTAYASHQTRTPTVSYLLQELPWLQQALLTAGITATTPEEIQQFIQSNSDLIAGGYIRDLDISIASVRRQLGAAAHWSSPHSFMNANLEWRWDNYRQPTGNVTSTDTSLRLGFRLNRQTDFTVGAALFDTHSPWRVLRSPLFTIGIRRELGNVPDLMTRLQQRGWISGTVFLDANESGENVGQKGIGGVTVILDDVHRTETDSLGHYSFKSLTEGQHRIEIQYEGSVPYQFTTPPQREVDSDTTVNFGISVRKALLMASVRDDAQHSVPNVAFRITGPAQLNTVTSASGTFLLSKLEAGEYTVSLDRYSLPASTVIEGSDSQVVAIEPDQPGRLLFTIRRLRSISGRVVCTGASVDVQRLVLQIDGVPSPVPLDEHGAFNIRNVASGSHQLILNLDGTERRQEVVVPDESGVVHIDVQACPHANEIDTLPNS